MKKFISNFIFQSIFQVVKLLMPILTVPIVSRALGPSNVGLYNFTQSITQYFYLLAGLGLALYAQRTIARKRDDKEELSKVFWELEAFSAITVVISLSLFFIITSFMGYRQIYLLQSLTVVSVLFDISWFFIGIEEFQLTSIRSLFISFLTFIFILLFVHNQEDTLKYIAIQTGGMLLSQIIMWPFLLKKVKFIKPKFKNIVRHFPYIIQYFIPQVAILLNLNLNKTVLGVMGTKSEVGFFSNSIIITTMIVVLISTVDTVLLPKLSNLHVKNDKKGILKVLDISLNIQFFFTIPIAVGLAVVSQKMVPWFFGESFVPIKYLMPMLACIVIINPMGASISRQWLVPNGKMKSYNFSVLLAAVVAVFLNIILIPYIGMFGTVVAAIISELIVTISRVVEFIKDTAFKYDKLKILKYVVSAIVMALVIYITTNEMPPRLIVTLIQVIIGIVVYFIITHLFSVNPISDFLLKMWNKKIK
ncbi:oligosaccharide flippase family protein [Enterococcus pseudoavium]|uniref:Oligosaccharide flippase family protein n=1 Tax=Enterococcus pseudoavium TaxID=44007 RepID=A0ABU3FK91_9ENTE|nr:oligosaccharide flippase family protein [Enterococcus pseudoavium]MDT2771485.1 oligosaccharide flippase family protein [Enterococcus pseudoavium]